MGEIRTVDLPTTDGPMALHEVRPDETPTAAVVLLPDARGLDDHARAVARRLSGAGYLTVVPELFHRDHAPDGHAPETGRVEALTTRGVEDDLEQTMEHLRRVRFKDHRIATLGLGIGGTASLVAGTRYALAGCVTFHGAGIADGRFGEPPLLELAPRLQSPWLGLYGDRDGQVPPDDVDRLRSAAAEAPIDTEVVRYADAGADLHRYAGDDASGPDASDAWDRALAFLAARLAD